MVDRVRSWWGWGWADEALTDEQAGKLAAALAARFGRDDLVLRDPPDLDRVDLRAPRVAPPSSLVAICSDSRYDRAAHALGKSYRDVVRGFSGRLDHPPDLVAFPTSEQEVVDVLDVEVDDELRPRFELRTPWGDVRVHLAARGEHQVANALAAAAAALAAGAPLDAIAAGLAQAELSPWRMDLRHAPSGALVLNDAYNANPASTEAALRSLARIDAVRRVAVLGPMAELGHHSAAEHARIGILASELGIRVVAVAAPEYGAAEHVDDLAAAQVLLGDLGPGDALLVKGSRVAGLERLAEALLTS